MSAYEELKAWCEKHLTIDDYKIVPESPSYCETIYFISGSNEDVPFVTFENGKFCCADICTNEEMCEHIRDYEENAD
jgi:hypothetical protein